MAAQPGAPAQQPNEFDLARKRAQQQSNAAVQSQRDAIKRRAAAQGGLNSGAFMKQEQQAMQKGQEQLAQANEGIDTAQRAEARRIKEIEDQRKFQSAERVAGQQFAASQADAQRKFAAAESALNRNMQSDQFEKTFGLSKEQFAAQKDQFGKQFGLQEQQFGLQKDQFAAAKDQFEKQFGFQKEQFEHEKFVDAFNMKLADKIANQKGLLEQLFSNFSMGSLGNFGGDASDTTKGWGGAISKAVKGIF